MSKKSFPKKDHFCPEFVRVFSPPPEPDEIDKIREERLKNAIHQPDRTDKNISHEEQEVCDRVG
jgi:hypothetical protein